MAKVNQKRAEMLIEHASWRPPPGMDGRPTIYDYARAYLAEHARADAAEAERDRLALRVETLTADRDQWATACSVYRAEVDRLADRVAELEAAARDWRTFSDEQPPLWMVEAHEARGGWWSTRSRQRIRTRVADGQSWMDWKIGVDGPQEWRPVLEDGTPAPWPVRGDATGDSPADGGDCKGVADAE